MTQNKEVSIELMNEVIAVFDGWEHHELKYHSDWNWLHSAWDKLRTTIWQENDGSYPSDFCAMSDVWEKSCFDGKIEAAHKLVFDAITWYNTTLKK